MKKNHYSISHWPKQFQKVPNAFRTRGYVAGRKKGYEDAQPQITRLWWALFLETAIVMLGLFVMKTW